MQNRGRRGFVKDHNTAPRYNDLDIAACALSRMNASRTGDDRMGRRFAAAWWAALCAVLVCLCATAPPVRQAEYPPWDGAPYFDAGAGQGGCQSLRPPRNWRRCPASGRKKALAIVEYREGERTVPRGGRTGTGKRHLGAHRRRHAGVCPGFLSRGSTAARCRLKGPCVYLKESFLWNSRIRGRYSSTGS